MGFGAFLGLDRAVCGLFDTGDVAGFGADKACAVVNGFVGGGGVAVVPGDDDLVVVGFVGSGDAEVD